MTMINNATMPRIAPHSFTSKKKKKKKNLYLYIPPFKLLSSPSSSFYFAHTTFNLLVMEVFLYTTTHFMILIFTEKIIKDELQPTVVKPCMPHCTCIE
jgi:hypothetical protein